MYYSEENSEPLHSDYKQFGQSMVNLDCANIVCADKNVSTNSSCDIVTCSGSAVASSSAQPNSSSVLSYKNAKQNLSESCVLNAATCNACSSLKIRSSCNINWTSVDIDKKVNSSDLQNQSAQYQQQAGGGKTNNNSSATTAAATASGHLQSSSAQYLDLNNSATVGGGGGGASGGGGVGSGGSGSGCSGNISFSNLRTNSYKINDQNYNLYNNNQFGECNHHHKQVNKFNGKNPATAAAAAAASASSSAASGVHKNNFFKNFARSSSFLNGCKIRPNSKKLRNISLKLKKSEKVQPSCAQQLSCQNLHTTHNNCGGSSGGGGGGGGGSSGGGSSITLSSGLIQNNCSLGTPPIGENKNRASLKLNDSIRNVYHRSSNQVIGGSGSVALGGSGGCGGSCGGGGGGDLKNQYNAKSNECNNYCHPSCHQQVLLNDFNKQTYVIGGARSKNDKSVRNKVFDRQLSVPIENTPAVNNLGIHATNKHCHSYSNSLNRSRKTGCKLNGRYVHKFIYFFFFGFNLL